MSYFLGGWLGLHFVTGLIKYQRQQARTSERERDTGFRVLGLGVGRQEKPAGGGHKGGGGGICIVRGFSLWPDWVLIVSGRMWHLLE